MEQDILNLARDRSCALTRFVASLAGNKSQRAVKSVLDAWFREVRRARWKNSADLKRSFGTAGIVGSDRAVLNIKGNDFRLVAAIDYRRQVIYVYIKWVGSHAENDLIDAETIQYEDQTDPDRR